MIKDKIKRNKKKVILIVVGVATLILVFALFSIFMFWYDFEDGGEYIKFLSHSISLDKMYSSKDAFSPAKEFRNDVIKRLEDHIIIPENYDFYFSEQINSHGWMGSSRTYTIHMNWSDENGFFYNIIAETWGSLSSPGFMRIDIYKQGVNRPLTFKDYIPSVYFFQGGYAYKENRYSRKESDFVEAIRKEIKLVIKNPELTLAEMTIPVIEIVRRPLGEEEQDKIIAVRVVSKEKDGRFKHEYDYDGDGRMDEFKIFDNVESSAIILVDRLGLNHTIVNYTPLESRWEILPDDNYEYFSRDFGFITRFVFDDPNLKPGAFRAGATMVEINGMTEEMRIRFFP